MEQLRTKFARVIEAVDDKSFLVAQRASLRASGNGPGHALRQRTNPGMRQEDLITGDGKFAPAKFLMGEQFGQGHAANLICEEPVRKAELKPVGDGGDLIEITQI